MNTSELIQPRHLDRRAEIYVRQSSPNQVITNKESQRMQYALRERAITLGWHEQDIRVIDTDLGRSGATTEGRAGYQEDVLATRNSSHRSRLVKSESCWPSTPLDWPATVRTGISCSTSAAIMIV